MHDKGRILINKAMKRKKISGLDRKCEYLTCHEGLEDCTFCYCPFYPCYQKDTSGFEKISSRTGQPIWSCSSCIFPHKIKNAKEILNGLIELSPDFNSISKEKLIELRTKILNQNCD
ncbi:MAG: cysteine-rich small domain-containing protein [Candidatus Odinarchaeota archaeon]